MIKETAKIVSAYLSCNRLAANGFPDLIRTTYQALAIMAAPRTERMQPAVPINKSVTPDAVTCLSCGRKFSMLKRHLRADHGVSAEQYRARWGLASTYPMVAPNYSKRRAAMASTLGLGQVRKQDGA